LKGKGGQSRQQSRQRRNKGKFGGDRNKDRDRAGREQGP